VNYLETTPSSSQEIKPPLPRKQHHQQQYAFITVTDTGPGLSPEQLALICSEGVQFNPNELQAGGGSGLGLWISQQIIDLHGGKLTITSPGLGLGATFQIKLPILRIETVFQTIDEERGLPSLSSVSPPVLPTNLRCLPKRVLLVDDTISNRKMLGRILKTHHIPFDEAEDGEKCLEKVLIASPAAASSSSSVSSSCPYDLILMDYEMPILNGPKATQRLRELGCRVIVIGVTGNVLQEDRDFFLRHGADAVLPKPVKINGLLEVFEKLAAERVAAAAAAAVVEGT
jgi:CheY-like chemotaxis protein